MRTVLSNVIPDLKSDSFAWRPVSFVPRWLPPTPVPFPDSI